VVTARRSPPTPRRTPPEYRPVGQWLSTIHYGPWITPQRFRRAGGDRQVVAAGTEHARFGLHLPSCPATIHRRRVGEQVVQAVPIIHGGLFSVIRRARVPAPRPVPPTATPPQLLPGSWSRPCEPCGVAARGLHYPPLRSRSTVFHHGSRPRIGVESLAEAVRSSASHRLTACPPPSGPPGGAPRRPHSSRTHPNPVVALHEVVQAGQPQQVCPLWRSGRAERHGRRPRDAVTLQCGAVATCSCTGRRRARCKPASRAVRRRHPLRVRHVEYTVAGTGAGPGPHSTSQVRRNSAARPPYDSRVYSRHGAPVLLHKLRPAQPAHHRRPPACAATD